MWPALIPLLGGLLDKLFPDPAAANEAKLKVMQMAQTGELAQLNADLQLATGQIEVNKVEAASTSLFVAGWRPMCGWICALALGFKYIGGPVLVMICATIGVQVSLPNIDSTELMPLLLGMLGLGALRTVEKIKNSS